LMKTLRPSRSDSICCLPFLIMVSFLEASGEVCRDRQIVAGSLV
jgi:hypothetical protein